ncbi:MAG TPA: glycosyltransferase, partial [Desulfomonilia bacterium]|nr:glycosyltransferase [Desulfomonilia bacterium]
MSHSRYLSAVFWFCFLLTGYVYFLYPIILTRLSRFVARNYTKSRITPPISIIISAYNEERSIARKIENTLSLDYPPELVEIIVGSDGSRDRTEEIVKSYRERGVRLLAFPENRGKTVVQNDCVREASHEIIVFMDAASMCERGALRKLVSNFADSRVGA